MPFCEQSVLTVCKFVARTHTEPSTLSHIVAPVCPCTRTRVIFFPYCSPNLHVHTHKRSLNIYCSPILHVHPRLDYLFRSANNFEIRNFYCAKEIFIVFRKFLLSHQDFYCQKFSNYFTYSSELILANFLRSSCALVRFTQCSKLHISC